MPTLIYILVSPAIFYLCSRALVTRWLWTRYPRWLTVFTDCAACLGFWLGILITITIGRHFELPYFGLEPTGWVAPIVVGLCSLVTTPIVAGLMQVSLEHLGTVVADDEAS